MKQPELGKKISELRKDKGLTQEELVNKCNITVRTLQRIEAGEVTPRSYTVKTILAALDYDLNKISDMINDNNKRNFFEWLRDVLLIDINPDKPANYLIKQLNIAWVFGLIYLILIILGGAAAYYKTTQDQMIFSIPFNICLKISVLIASFFFQRGFIIAGHFFKNYLLKIMSFVLIFGMFLLISYDIISIFYKPIEHLFILRALALIFGVIDILFGVSLIKLKKSLGPLPVIAGIFIIIAACFFLTFSLAYVGLIILIPYEILKIVILYKAVELIKTKQLENETTTT
ncbi:MAG: helix-turn-helix transcriptional regulator [Bacteroidales bacterium]|jgi:transcriptional regulator with XRE-family HTH domain